MRVLLRPLKGLAAAGVGWASWIGEASGEEAGAAAAEQRWWRASAADSCMVCGLQPDLMAAALLHACCQAVVEGAGRLPKCVCAPWHCRHLGVVPWVALVGAGRQGAAGSGCWHAWATEAASTEVALCSGQRCVQLWMRLWL